MITSDLNDLTQVLKDNAIKLYTFEHNISFDCDLSRIYFDDFKSDIENQSLWFDSEYLVIFENKALKETSYYEESQLAKMSKEDLYDLCEQFDILEYCHSQYKIEDNTKQNLIDELMCQIDKKTYYKHEYENASNWYDLECSFVIRGHCQGDACKVLLVGDVEQWINVENLENLFYNTPLRGSVDVYLNGELLHEINLNDFEGFNSYDYLCKKEVIQLLTDNTKNQEYHDLLIEYLNDNLEETFDYSY